MSDDGAGGIGGFVTEVRRSMAIDATKKIIWWVLGAILAGAALVILEGGTVPAWTLLAVVVLLLALAVLWRGWTKRQMTVELEALRAESERVGEDADAMAFGLTRHETYCRHVAQSLDALQRVVSGH